MTLWLGLSEVFFFNYMVMSNDSGMGARTLSEPLITSLHQREGTTEGDARMMGRRGQRGRCRTEKDKHRPFSVRGTSLLAYPAWICLTQLMERKTAS